MKINKEVKRLKELFNLQDWDIKISRFESEDFLGQTDFHYFSKNAKIQLNKCLNKKELKQTLLHEFIHLALASIDDLLIRRLPEEDEDIKLLIEHAVLRIEGAFK